MGQKLRKTMGSGSEVEKKPRVVGSEVEKNMKIKLKIVGSEVEEGNG